MKLMNALGVVIRVPLKFKGKGKFFSTSIRPAILYGVECYAVNSQQENKINVAETKML